VVSAAAREEEASNKTRQGRPLLCAMLMRQRRPLPRHASGGRMPRTQVFRAITSLPSGLVEVELAVVV